MERELITSSFSYSGVTIEETKIKSFNRNCGTGRSFRVYDGVNAGIQYIQGKIDEEAGYRKAQDNLVLKRPYKYTPETGSRRRDKSEREYTDRELMDISRETVDYLKTRFPDYIFSGSVSVTKKTLAMKNSLGLDYSNTDCALQVNITIKHRDSRDISDGGFSISQRDFDFSKLTDMADNYLTNFTNMVELPGELIIQTQYYEYLSKLNQCLEAENMALGTSLLSGRIGEKVFADSFTLTHDVSDQESWFTTFFDGEGVVRPEDRFTFIRNGVLLSGYADKRTAEKYGVAHTGSASFNMTDVPNNGYVDLRIERSGKTVRQLLDGRLTVVPVRAFGGGFNDKGEYVTPVQTAMLCDGERFIGRLPEFAIKGNLFDMFGKNFIGVGSDNPVFNDKQILVKMDYSR